MGLPGPGRVATGADSVIAVEVRTTADKSSKWHRKGSALVFLDLLGAKGMEFALSVNYFHAGLVEASSRLPGS